MTTSNSDRRVDRMSSQTPATQLRIEFGPRRLPPLPPSSGSPSRRLEESVPEHWQLPRTFIGWRQIDGVVRRVIWDKHPDWTPRQVCTALQASRWEGAEFSQARWDAIEHFAWHLPPPPKGRRSIEATLDEDDRWKGSKNRKARKRLDNSVFYTIAFYRPDWTHQEIKDAVEESRWEGGAFSEERKRLIRERAYLPSASEIEEEGKPYWWTNLFWIGVFLLVLWLLPPIPLASLDARSLLLLLVLWIWMRR